MLTAVLVYLEESRLLAICCHFPEGPVQDTGAIAHALLTSDFVFVFLTQTALGCDHVAHVSTVILVFW